MATIIGKDKIATISFDEVDAAKVQNGQPVNITFDAIDNFTATGTVTQIDQVGIVTQGVVSYSVKIKINTVDDRIKPGMSVSTTIITNQKDGVVVVPSAAIKTTNGKSYVQVFDPSKLNVSTPNASTTRAYSSQSGRQFASSTQNKTMTISSATPPAQFAITTGLSDDTNTEIVSGLNRGQLIVTRTIAASATKTTATPTLFSTMGARTGGSAGGASYRQAGGGMPIAH